MMNFICFYIALLLTPFQITQEPNQIRSLVNRESEPSLKAPNEPIEVEVTMNINKIYDINSINGTYIIDGYFVAEWINKKNSLKNHSEQPLIFENNLVDEKRKNEIWVPVFEFINVIGSRNTVNKQIIVKSRDRVIYNERFNAVLTAPMDFRNFPFDSQKFSIQLEAFTYDNKSLVFCNEPTKIVSLQEKIGKKVPKEWEMTNIDLYVNTKEYSHLSEKPSSFSRYNLDIYAKRKIRYYLWQFIIPLFLIISVSWTVFWIPEMSDQLSTGFTLMLTVVAFNFHTSSMLPNLPYNTFIESMITLGYISIFISLILVVFGRWTTNKTNNYSYVQLMNHCKYMFPLAFLLLTLIQAIIFL